jgi:hypothetical protein
MGARIAVNFQRILGQGQGGVNMSSWQEQLDRARRYHQRLIAFVAAEEHKADIILGLDDSYAFFQNCYHIKDWLKNDPAFLRAVEVEGYITSTPALSLCADIANGIKHLLLTKKPRSGSTPGPVHATLVVKLEDSFAAGEERPPSMSMQLKVEHAGRELDAIQIAADAMQAWESFVC